VDFNRIKKVKEVKSDLVVLESIIYGDPLEGLFGESYSRYVRWI
jgi:hypothetical protein